MNQLSIITINYNNNQGLVKTIESVVCQTFDKYEFIIVDGGSTDGSKDTILKNIERVTYWVSEPDRGIYHAMNKGIKAAKGKYCLFLNSGDWLAKPDILQQVFAENPQADIVSGNINFFDNQKNEIKWYVPSPDQLTAKTLFQGSLPHQATFIKRNLFEHIGFYNEQLKIASDWLFFVEALLVRNATYQHFKGVVAYFNMDGISCDPATKSLPRREQLIILQEKYPLFLPDYDRLDQLEKQSQQWLQSWEYRVYRFLVSMGVIRLGVFSRRVKRVIQRKVFRQYNSEEIT